MSLRASKAADLIRRYGGPGPRYTSYPGPAQFGAAFGEAEYCSAAVRSQAARPGAPLSVYVHVPFCASPCFYCACNRVITRQHEQAKAYLHRLETEIALQGRLFAGTRPVEQLHFGGGTPTFMKLDQIGCVLGSLSRHFGFVPEAAREFSIEIDPRTLPVEMLPELRGLGFSRISLGVQDFDPRVQAAVNREQSMKETLDLIGGAHAAGMRSVSVDLIYGLPHQSLAGWERTLDLIAAARPDRIAAYGYAHLPERFKAQGQIDAAVLPSPEVRLELLGLTIARLRAAGYVQVGLDHFALPQDELARGLVDGRLQRNFQGYSTRGGLELLGIGMSAIGQLDDTHAQNARTLDRYYQAIDSGHLAIECGVRLNADDRIRRDAIMSLMCRGRLDFARIGALHGLDAATYFSAELDRLQPLERDGLVRITPEAVETTAAGRPFVRAVAMVFDAYLARVEAPRRKHSAVV